MALQDRDATQSVTYDRDDKPVEIIFRRTPKEGTVNLEVIVVYEAEKDGETHRYTKRVPKNLVDGAWTSDTRRTLKNTLLAIIDNAE